VSTEERSDEAPNATEFTAAFAIIGAFTIGGRVVVRS